MTILRLATPLEQPQQGQMAWQCFGSDEHCRRMVAVRVAHLAAGCVQVRDVVALSNLMVLGLPAAGAVLHLRVLHRPVRQPKPDLFRLRLHDV